MNIFDLLSQFFNSIILSWFHKIEALGNHFVIISASRVS